MAEFDLSARHPGFRPIDRAPRLPNFLGFGLFLRGERDFDERDGSFARTLCVCALFVPVFAARSYRVAPTEDGWRFVGRGPASTLSKALSWSALVTALLAGGYSGYHAYTSTPSYVGRQKMAQAGSLGEAGRYGDSARLLGEVARGPSEHASEAARRLQALLEDPAAAKDTGALGAVYGSAVEVQKAGRWPSSSQSLYKPALALVKGLAATRPRDALILLDSIEAIGPKEDDRADLRRAILEKAVAATPGDVELASRLADDCEARDQLDRCESILAPVRDQLGDREGARVLGMIDARAGRIDPAIALLRGYCKGKLAHLAQVDAALRAAYEAGQKRLLDRLKTQRAGDFDYLRYRRADAAGQRKILIEYVQQGLKADGEILRLQGEMAAQSRAVGVVLELGMALLQRSQTRAEPAARKADLDEAEAMFLAISRLAGDRAELQLSLGQVYYWQGKHEQGRALFDAVLKSRARAPEVLLQVSSMLRDVGSVSEARALAEEAFRAAKDAKVRDEAAVIRGVLGTDVDDRVRWLREAKSDEPSIRALLLSDLGAQAIQRGEESKAAEHFRQCVALYDAMPESTGVLNNASIALGQLADLTGDRSLADRAAAKMERAAALDPGHSLTLSNASASRLEVALRDLIGGSIDLPLIRRRASPDLLDLLAVDDPGRDALAARVRAQPGINRALAMMDKVALLAPSNPDSYAHPLRVLGVTRDLDGVRKLAGRLAGAGLDLDDARKEREEVDSGRDDDRLKQSGATALARAEARLAAARSRGGATFAAAAVDVIQARVAAASAGIDPDADATVDLAREAVAASPSIATSRMLRLALMARADRRLARSSPEYAAHRARFRRSSTVNGRIAAILSAEGGLKDATIRDPDVALAIDLLRESFASAPDSTSSAEAWACLRAKYPDDAASMARRYLSSELDRLNREVRSKLAPHDPGSAMLDYWTARMQGRDDLARTILQRAKAGGLPIPIDLP